MIILAAQRRQNITVDPVVFDEFCRYAGPQGIKISTWINAKMKEFVDDQKALEEMKKNRK